MHVSNAHQFREHDSLDSTAAARSLPSPAVLFESTYKSSVGQGTEEQRNRFRDLCASCVSQGPEEKEATLDKALGFVPDVATKPDQNSPELAKKEDPMRDHQSVTYQEMCQIYPGLNPIEQQNLWMNVMVFPMAAPVWPMQQPPAALVVEDVEQPSGSGQGRKRGRSRSRPVKGPMPGSDEDWSQRIKKRLEGMEAMRKSDAYLSNLSLRRGVRPQTPDPYDHCLSKRDWEKALGGCRAFHRNVHTLQQMGYDRARTASAWLQAVAIFDRHSSCSRHDEKVLEQIWNKAVEILGPIG